MKLINTFAEILQLAEQGKLYVRWSRGPAMDKKQGHSRDYVSGSTHSGLSCQSATPDYDYMRTVAHARLAMMLVEYSFLQRKDSKIYGWLFRAEENGRDSDNAPTVDAATIVPVGKMSQELVSKLQAFNAAYWQDARGPKSGVKLSDFVA